MYENIQQIADEIKSIKIQWATNIAKSAFQIMKSELESQTFESVDALKDFLRHGAQLLIDARQTEPMLFNGMKYAKFTFEKNRMDVSKDASIMHPISELQKAISNSFDFFLTLIKNEKEKRANYGADLIKDGMTIFTHCHSSSVVELLVKAQQQGKKFRIYNSETRPLYQGRKTSAELVAAGIDTTQVVDWCGPYLINKSIETGVHIDMVLLGSDAITLSGNVMNKVGSFAIGLSAHTESIPVYIVGSLTKVDMTNTVNIEMRDPHEVRPDAPAWLKIANYAFDAIPADYITGIITEFGIIPATNLPDAIKKNYPRMLDL